MFFEEASFAAVRAEACVTLCSASPRRESFVDSLGGGCGGERHVETKENNFYDVHVINRLLKADVARESGVCSLISFAQPLPRAAPLPALT